jgi:hypothetical protein
MIDLVLGHDHPLAVQEVIFLGVQAPFLTRVNIYLRPVEYNYIWDTYNTDAAATTTAATTTAATATATAATAEDKSMAIAIAATIRSDAVVENQRLRKCRQAGSKDILLFLQHCSSLSSFSLTGYCTTSQDLIEGGGDGDGDNKGDEKGEERLLIEPWPCKDIHETLTIGINMSTKHSDAHNNNNHRYHALVLEVFGTVQETPFSHTKTIKPDPIPHI